MERPFEDVTINTRVTTDEPFTGTFGVYSHLFFASTKIDAVLVKKCGDIPFVCR